MDADQPHLATAERARLLAALANGPERRITQDRARGLEPQRADMNQAIQYRSILAALNSFDKN